MTYPFTLGAAAGSFLAFGGAAVLVFQIMDGGVDQSAIATAVGSGIGAIATVVCAHLVEEMKRAKSASTQARLVLANLGNVRGSLLVAEELVRAIRLEIGVDEAVERTVARLREGQETINQIIQAQSALLPDVVPPGLAARDAVGSVAWAFEVRSNSAGALSRLLADEDFLDRNVQKGLSEVDAMTDACRRYI